jgi:paraquat-inducible protein B
MSEELPAPGIEAAEAEVVQRRGPSIVWLIPIVAVIIGATIWWQTSANRGPEVTILFTEGGGIEPGKTKVRYRGLEVGEVLEVGIRDIDTVEVRAELGPGAWPFMTSETKFWIEKPRIGTGGISGLDTLVSGAYIAVLPAVDEGGTPIGHPTTEFDGLMQPPMSAVYPNALRIGLETPDLRGLTRGADLRFRDIRVGEVERYEIKPDGQGVRVWALIAEEYKDLVRPSTEFWNSSGVEVEIRPSGVRIEAESLASMLGGGIDFETPPEAYIERPVGDGAIFRLHESRADAVEALEQGVGLRLWLESREVGSLAEGDGVYYRDVEIGRAGEPELSEDALTVRFPIHVAERYRTLIRKNSRFWNRSGFSFKAGLRGVETRVGTIGTLLAGGVVLATPDRPGEEVEDDSVFVLHPKPDDAWLGWSPKIVLREVNEEDRLPHVARLYPERPSGLRVVLVADRQGSLSAGSPVYFRDRLVGEIGELRFSADARHVEADAWIDSRYATLVRSNTRFWNASGIDVDAGLTSGVKIRTQSMEAILAGGVAFATPDSAGATVESGARFTLYEEPKKEWIRWSPALPLR